MPRSEVEVHTYAARDLPEFGEWFGRAWLDARGREPEGAAGSTYLIALRDGRPVGHGNVRWDGSLHPTWQAHIRCPELNGLGVKPQGQGIGSLLIKHAEDLARDRGLGELGVGVEVDNDRARALYERLGYVMWDGGAVRMLGGNENYFLTKELGDAT